MLVLLDPSREEEHFTRNSALFQDSARANHISQVLRPAPASAAVGRSALRSHGCRRNVADSLLHSPVCNQIIALQSGDQSTARRATVPTRRRRTLLVALPKLHLRFRASRSGWAGGGGGGGRPDSVSRRHAQKHTDSAVVITVCFPTGNRTASELY